MNHDERGQSIIEKALFFGATLAGIAETKAIKKSPSHMSGGKMDWPRQARSALVMALVHGEAEPELDWWGVEMGTAGNRKLHDISGQLKEWLKNELKLDSWILPYQLEKNGIYLKDAAVLAGLGTIGANNLLLAPKFGPRLRLRALFLDAELKPTEPGAFAPCAKCAKPCWRACPQKTFVSGAYVMTRCQKQMLKDESKRPLVIIAKNAPPAYVKYCRTCELSCPAGKDI